MTVLRVLPDDVRVQTEPGETVLESLYAAGFSYRTGCRNGGCTICKADIRAGSVSYLKTVAESVLSEDERTTGTCLTCRAVPDGDLTIELRHDQLRQRNPFFRSARVLDTDPLDTDQLDTDHTDTDRTGEDDR